MTIKEYVEKNHMTYTELAKLVGCPLSAITNIVKRNTAIKDVNRVKKFKELGIEVRAYNPKLNKKKESGTGYLYYEKIQVAKSRIDEIYCYTVEKVNAVTGYLNQRGICYYVRCKEGYWIVKYDRTIKEEEWVQ